MSLAATCPPLSLSHGKVHYNRFPINGRYLVYTTVSFICNAGYLVSGTSSRTCQNSGNWNNETPTCNADNEAKKQTIDLLFIAF